MLRYLLIAVMTLAGFSADALAWYNPRTGTFMQRDPLASGVSLRIGNGPNVAVRSSFTFARTTSDQMYDINNHPERIMVHHDVIASYPDGLNIRTYVRNNPLSLVDPYGLCSEDIPRGPTPNGCGAKDGISVPDGGPFGGWTFEPACNDHDRCYGTCGQSKTFCDQEFLRAMLASCRQSWRSTGRLRYTPPVYLAYRACIAQAHIYYKAVSWLGKDAYDKAQKAACARNPRLGPPPPGFI